MEPIKRKSFLSAVFLIFGLFPHADGAAPAQRIVRVVNVAEYGISPDSKNNYSALKKLLDAAASDSESVEVRFKPDAVYRIGLPDGANLQSQYALLIQQATNLVVDGQGATLRVTNPESGAICTEDCRNIAVKNFKIDYDPLPYTQGRIHAVNLAENWFELKVDDGFLEPDQPCFGRAMAKWGLAIRDLSDGRRQYGPDALFAQKWEKTGEHIWRFYTKKSRYDTSLSQAGLKPGERYIHLARNYAQAVAAKKCDEILWENITVFASPGLAFYPHITSHHTIRNCHVAVKEGRIFSTNADGIHMRGSRGHVLIEGCSFEGMADDAINVHSSAMSVQAQPAPNQVLVKKHTYSVRPGDRLVAVRSESASILAEAVVKAVDDQGQNWLITLTGDLPVLQCGAGFSVSDNLYNLSESADPFVIRNCTFGDYRGRGIVISAHGGIIENNIFRVQEGWGIVMDYESSRWAEGPIAYDVVIRNNQFFAGPESRQPAILSAIHTRSGAVVKGAPFKNIRIEGNHFHGYKTPISMRHAENIQILENEERDL